MKVLLVFLSLLVSCSAELTKVSNIRYKKSPVTLAKRQQLDVYYDAKAVKTPKPVLIWIHGGAWKFGNKEHSTEKKAQWAVKQGYVLVALNYRFHPRVNYETQCADVADAIKWVSGNIAKYGGERTKLATMGHSAGAHLALLTVADPRYLKAAGVDRSAVKVAISLDGGGLDIPLHLTLAKASNKKLYLKVFGEHAKGHKEASPISYLKKAKQPKFLVLAVAVRKSTPQVAKSFKKAVNASGGVCESHSIKGKTHMTLNRDIGKEGDKSTQILEGFLKEHL